MSFGRMTRRTAMAGLCSSAAAAGIARPVRAPAFRFGVQLYTLQSAFAANMPHLFERLAQAGYSTVEFAGFANYSSMQIRQALAQTGLVGLGAHCLPLTLTNDDAQRQLDKCAEIGLSQAVTALASVRPTAEMPNPKASAIFAGISVDDLRWSANRMNHFAALAGQRGLTYAYHVHNVDFRPTGGEAGLDWLARLTNPARVLFQLDLGNAWVAGIDLRALIARYRRRLCSVHVKDWIPGGAPSFGLHFPHPADFGKGAIDWKPVLDALTAVRSRDIVIEQEFRADVDVFAAQVQALEYLKATSETMRPKGRHTSRRFGLN